MAQGKKFTNEEKEEIIQSLRPYLEKGLSRNKACNIIGLPTSTLSNWIKENESLGIRIQSYENTMALMALTNIYSALKKEKSTRETDKKTSKWYLERKLRDDFSTKQNVDVVSDGKEIKGFSYLAPDEHTDQAD